MPKRMPVIKLPWGAGAVTLESFTKSVVWRLSTSWRAGCVSVLGSSHSLIPREVLVVLTHPYSAASSPANTVPVAAWHIRCSDGLGVWRVCCCHLRNDTPEPHTDERTCGKACLLKVLLRKLTHIPGVSCVPVCVCVCVCVCMCVCVSAAVGCSSTTQPTD